MLVLYATVILRLEHARLKRRSGAKKDGQGRKKTPRGRNELAPPFVHNLSDT